MSEKYSVEMRNIDKKFGGVHALKDVSVRFCSGDIHSLVGENGAGKSTLIKILSGMYVKDSGELLIHGKTVEAKSVFEMKKKRALMSSIRNLPWRRTVRWPKISI